MIRNLVLLGDAKPVLAKNRRTDSSFHRAPHQAVTNLKPSFDLLLHYGGIFTDSFSFLVEDFDECKAHEDNCGQHGTCVNNVGSFECKCKDGFEGDGISCEGN